MRFTFLFLLLLCQLAQAELVSRRITMYADGVGLVEESHRFRLQEGINYLAIENLLADMMPFTLSLTPDVGRIVELETRKPARRPTDLLLEAEGQHVELTCQSGRSYCGLIKTVNLLQGDLGPRQSWELLNAIPRGNLLLIQDDGSRIILDLESVSAVSLPEPMDPVESARCDFRWYSSSRQRGELKLEYFIPDLFSVVECKGELDEYFKVKRKSLHAEALLWNYSASELKDCELYLSSKISSLRFGPRWFELNQPQRRMATRRVPPYELSESYRQGRVTSDSDLEDPVFIGEVNLAAGGYLALPLKLTTDGINAACAHRTVSPSPEAQKLNCELVLCMTTQNPEELANWPSGFLILEYQRMGGDHHRYHSGLVSFAPAATNWISMGRDPEVSYTRTIATLTRPGESADSLRHVVWEYTLSNSLDRIAKVYIHEESGARNEVEIVRGSHRWKQKENGYVMEVDLPAGETVEASWEWQAPRVPQSVQGMRHPDYMPRY